MTHTKFLALVIGMIMAGLLVTPGWAASLSITSVSIPTSVNQGESFTLTAQMSATSVNTGQAQLSGSPLPTQISCTPTATQSVTLSGGSGSASWNCTGNVAGDYSSKITVTATDADGQAPEAQSQTGLMVLAPASITASATTSVSSIDINCGTSATFNYTVGVNDAGDVDATGIGMTPSPYGFSGYTLSPSSYSGQTVGAKSLKNFHFTVTVTQTGTLSFAAISVTSTNAGSANTTVAKSVTVTNSTGACPASVVPTPTSSTGTSYVAPTAVQESTTIDTIVAGQSSTITMAQSAETGIKAIKLAVKNTVTSVKVTTAQLTSLPSSIPAAPVSATTGGVYKYVEISATIPVGDIDKVTIGFQVAKSWVTANGINVATIALSRYADGTWNKLPSTKTNEDSTYYYFDAESPGFSTFAIVGEKVAAITTSTPTPVPTATGAPTAVPTASPTPTAAGISIPIIPGKPPVQIPFWVIAVAIIIVVAYIYKKKMPPAGEKKNKYSYEQRK